MALKVASTPSNLDAVLVRAWVAFGTTALGATSPWISGYPILASSSSATLGGGVATGATSCGRQSSTARTPEIQRAEVQSNTGLWIFVHYAINPKKKKYVECWLNWISTNTIYDKIPSFWSSSMPHAHSWVGIFPVEFSSSHSIISCITVRFVLLS